MKGKVSIKDGVHINSEGDESLHGFLVRRFTSYKPEQHQIRQQPAPRTRNDSYADNRSQYPVERGSERVNDPRHRGPPPSRSMMHQAWGQPDDVNIQHPNSLADGQHYRGWNQQEFNRQYPPLREDGPSIGTSQGMVSRQPRDPLRDLSEALATVMYSHLYRHV